VLVDFWQVVLAVALGVVILKVGFAMLGGLARPVPAPPPEGELRRVRLRYRCSLCGMELRIDRAGEQLPEPPRHCQEEMDLMTPEEDLEL
jgi:hypothetical protein